MGDAMKDYSSFLYQQLEEKSDAELQRRVLELARQSSEIRADGSSATTARLRMMLEETKVCSAILNDRKDKRERGKNAAAEWKKNLPERRYAAVLNLENAVTQNGQLVVAILEEEGESTEAELSAACREYKEFAAMDPAELRKLFAALEKEGVLTRRNKKYSIAQICTPELFPDEPVAWAIRKMGRDWDEKEIEVAILFMIARQGAAVTEEWVAEQAEHTTAAIAVREMVKIGFFKGEDVNEELAQIRDGLRDLWRREAVLQNLVSRGALCETEINGITLYYFPMLGEREAD